MVEQVEIACSRCKQSCYGDVISAYGKYYHQYCFSCVTIGCDKDPAKDGFFIIDDEIYCRDDYRKLMGVKCAGCAEYVEGDAVCAMDFKFHPSCFGCVSCGMVFPVGSEICYDGEDFFCKICNATCNANKMLKELAHIEQAISEQANEDQLSEKSELFENENKCAGCENYIKEGQSLLALEKQWHLWCFTCFECGSLLTAEYMGREGTPYCENDYQAKFGISCAGCNEYITGKVLQAGERHYHPQCSRCAKCGEMFGEGEDMYLQGSDIWHPACSDAMDNEAGSGGDSAVSDDLEIDSPRSCNETDIVPPQAQPQPMSNGWTSSAHPVPFSKPPDHRTGKPYGFRSVQPPTGPKTETRSSVPNNNENAPPIPPPPTRSSSSQWRQKYFPARIEDNEKSKTDSNQEEHSLDSEGSDSEKPVCHLSSGYSTNSLDSESSSKAASRKGIGYNRLQQRRNNKESRTNKLPTSIDPDRLRQFLDDPDHNVYLEDHEFVQIFKMSREKFYALPQSKKQELKSGILFT